MLAPIDDATSQFLEAAADDLERHLPWTGQVEAVVLTDATQGIALRARIRFGAQVVQLDGSGDSLVTAYADLRARLPEARLAAAFRELIRR